MIFMGGGYSPSSMPPPLPSRPKRKGSVLSLEERRTDSPPATSSSLSTLRKWRKKKREGKEVKMETSDQNGCFLLSRLPYELRMMVYREVLAGHNLHIVLTEEVTKMKKKKKKKEEESKRTLLSHIICCAHDCHCCFYDRTSIDRWDVDPESWNRCTCGGKWYLNSDKLAIQKKTRSGLLSLLKTCWQVYREAITILYSSNTFDFPHLGALFTFKSTILPQRQAAIRSIQVFYTYDSSCTGNLYHLDHITAPLGHNLWWGVIAGGNQIKENNSPMTSLKEIRLVIPNFCEFIYGDTIHPLFNPMGELLNAAAKAWDSGRRTISVVVDFPVWFDRNNKAVADVLRKAPFLKLRTPRRLH